MIRTLGLHVEIVLGGGGGGGRVHTVVEIAFDLC